MMAIPPDNTGSMPIVEAGVKKNIDKKKIEKALESFWNKFNIDDLYSANKEVSDLIEIAQFNPIERSRFITSIKKSLNEKGIILDFLM